MKTLSLKQPFAELVVSGRKTIELRKWNTKFRGEFLVHASRIPDKSSMEKFGFANLPCGFIVGKVKLIDIKRYKDDGEFEEDKNKHLANKNWGEYGFILEDAQRFDKLIPAKGMLSFWEFEI